MSQNSEELILNHPEDRSLFAAKLKLYSPSSLAKYGRNSRKTVFNDPYTSAMKARFEDAWRAETVVRRAINAKVSFIVGKKLPVGVDVRQVQDDDEARDEAINGLLGQQDVKNYRRELETINRRVKFKPKIEAAVAQALIGGRSALGIQFGTFNERQEPADLRVLNWVKLGRVKLVEDDKGEADYKIESVLYNDEQFDKNGIPASSMLYFTNIDWHVSPNSLFYGYSEIEPVAHLAESNRLIDEVVIKEINRSLWAGNLLIQMATKDRNVVTEFLNKYDPGKPIGTNKETTIQDMKIQHDLVDLIQERTENERRILRGLSVPSMLVGFENVTNRATTESVLHAWKVSDIDSKQEWLADTLNVQWYDSNFKIISGMEDDAIEKLEYRFVQDYQQIIFDSFVDKADAVMKLFTAKMIPLEKALEMLDLRDVLKDVQKLQDEKAKQDQEDKQAQIEAMQKGQQQAPKPAFGGKQ